MSKKDTQFRYHNRYDVAAIRDPKIKLPIIYIPPACKENCCKITIETSPAGDAAQGYIIYIKPKYIAEMALKVISECTHAGCWGETKLWTICHLQQRLDCWNLYSHVRIPSRGELEETSCRCCRLWTRGLPVRLILVEEGRNLILDYAKRFNEATFLDTELIMRYFLILMIDGWER